MVVSWPEFLSPKRSGCFIWFTSVKAGGLDSDREVILVGEDLRRPVETLDLLSVLPDEARHLVRRGLPGVDLRRGVDAHHVVSDGIGVEVQSNIWVGLDVAHLL